MTGTVIASLSAAHQADNTAVTPANSAWSSISVGAGNTQVHLAAAAMGEAEGYRFTQGGANPNFSYLDLPAAQSVFAWRMPFRYTFTPAVSLAMLRAFPAVDHVTNLWTLQITTANRVQAVEAGGGTMNVTSAAGTPLVPGNDYVGLGLANSTTGAYEFRCYQRASSTALFILTGTLTAPQPVFSGRFGIATASSIPEINTNSAFAFGAGDVLARTDIATTPLAVAPTVLPSSGPPSTSFAFAANPSGGNGNAITYAWNFGDGNTGTGATPSHVYASIGSYTFDVTASQA